jgi:predicted metalloprotease
MQMKWQDRRGSRNIEDRRRSGGGKSVGGIGGIACILILVLGWYFGVDVSGFVGEPTGGQAQ